MPRSHFNGIQFNANHFNGGFIGESATYSTDLAVFDGFSLDDRTIMTVTDLFDSAAERELLEGRIPRDDGEYVNGDYWRKKPIEMQGIISRSSATLLENYLDTVRKNLRKRERNLDITRKDNGTVISVRRYTATWINPQELFYDRKRHDVTKCPFNIKFKVHKAFGFDRSYTVVTEDLTTSPTSIFAENTGTAPTKPVITLNFSAASSVTVVNVKRVEPSSGETLEEMEYSGSVAAGDWVRFDSEEKTAKKTEATIDYTGSFLTMEPGGNLYKITVTGTSFTARATIKSKSAYL